MFFFTPRGRIHKLERSVRFAQSPIKNTRIFVEVNGKCRLQEMSAAENADQQQQYYLVKKDFIGKNKLINLENS